MTPFLCVLMKIPDSFELFCYFTYGILKKENKSRFLIFMISYYGLDEKSPTVLIFSIFITIVVLVWKWYKDSSQERIWFLFFDCFLRFTRVHLLFFISVTLLNNNSRPLRVFVCKLFKTIFTFDCIFSSDDIGTGAL